MRVSEGASCGTLTKIGFVSFVRMYVRGDCCGFGARAIRECVSHAYTCGSALTMDFVTSLAEPKRCGL
jgi:hypothetical protein